MRTVNPLGPTIPSGKGPRKTMGKSDAYTRYLLRNAKKPPRRSPGLKALMEIRKLWKTTKLVIPMAPFIRLIRQIALKEKKLLKQEPKWQGDAVLAIKESAEMYLVQLFEDSLIRAHHANRVTVMVKDMIVVRRIRQNSGLKM